MSKRTGEEDLLHNEELRVFYPSFNTLNVLNEGEFGA